MKRKEEGKDSKRSSINKTEVDLISFSKKTHKDEKVIPTITPTSAFHKNSNYPELSQKSNIILSLNIYLSLLQIQSHITCSALDLEP